MSENSTEISSLTKEIVRHYSENGWPAATLFTGEQTYSKKSFIINIVADELYRQRLDESLDLNKISQMMKENLHPDFYYFSSRQIKIGDSKKPEYGTVRHLLNHFLSYGSNKSKKKIVYFEDASYILNEAESALLKSLEEPPENTVFFLSTSDSGFLKETIVSRTVMLPVETIMNSDKIPVDEWLRFWFLSGANSAFLEKLNEYGWIEAMKEKYDKLSFSPEDFLIFEDLGHIEFRKIFKNENIENQIEYLKLTFLPVLYAVRDNLTEGSVPSIAPFRAPFRSRKKNLALAKVIEKFFQRLSIRYFGTRPPNINSLFFFFLANFMDIWNLKDSS
ncbi:MAG: hypothetical protein OEZ13_01870 [Spirochaetia bacterium]|nr:hypothetical protein [Spirochaetia bacterium]